MTYRIKNTKIKTEFDKRQTQMYEYERNEDNNHQKKTFMIGKNKTKQYKSKNKKENSDKYRQLMEFQQVINNENNNSRQQVIQYIQNDQETDTVMPFGINNEKKIKKKSFAYDQNINNSQNEQFLDRVLRVIQKQTNYDQITEQQIDQERAQLKNLIKQLNQKLNFCFFNEEAYKNQLDMNQPNKNIAYSSYSPYSIKNQQNVHTRKLTKMKTSMAEATQLKYESILQQIHNNYKLLSIMKNQYSFLSSRIKHISDPHNKLSVQSKIAQIFMQIKNLKSQISVINTKKLQNQKIFVKGNKKSSILLNQLQDQNLNLMRNIQSLQMKTSQIESQQSKLMNLSKKADDQYKFLKQLIEEKGLKVNKNSIVSKQHQKLMYDTNKRKLQLALRKSERDQQNFKRRYYQLLTSLDKYNQDQNNTDLKITQAQQKTQFLKNKMNFLKQQLKDPHKQTRIKKSVSSFQQNKKMKNQYKYKYEYQNDYLGNQSDQEDFYNNQDSFNNNERNFMLTEIKQTKKIKSKGSMDKKPNKLIRSSNQSSYNNSQKNSQIKQKKVFNLQLKNHERNSHQQKFNRFLDHNPTSKFYSSSPKHSQKERYSRVNKSLGALNADKDFKRKKLTQNQRYRNQNEKNSNNHQYFRSLLQTPINQSFIKDKQKVKNYQNKLQKYTQSQKQVEEISEDEQNILQRLLQKNIKDRQTKLKENLFRNPLQKYDKFQQTQAKSINMSQMHVPKLKTVLISDKEKKKQLQRNQFLKKSSLIYQQIQEQIQYESMVPSARKQLNVSVVEQQIEEIKQ